MGRFIQKVIFALKKKRKEQKIELSKTLLQIQESYNNTKVPGTLWKRGDIDLWTWRKFVNEVYGPPKIPFCVEASSSLFDPLFRYKVGQKILKRKQR